MTRRTDPPVPPTPPDDGGGITHPNAPHRPAAVTLADGRTVRLGRIKPKARPQALRLAPYLDFSEVHVPDSVDYTAKAAPSLKRVYLNDRYGCCLPPGTMVRMADGSVKPIEEVKVREQVMTAEGNTGPVNAVMARYVNEGLVRVVAWGHSHLRMTAEHPVLTRRGYVPAGELTAGDWIALPVRPAGNRAAVRVRDHAGGAKVPADFPEVIPLTREFGRLIGLFLAEGSTNRRIACWSFGEDERDTLVAETQELSRAFFDKGGSLSKRHGASLYVRVCGKFVCAFLRSLCGAGAANKRLHPDLVNGPPEFLRAVLDGWLDGDGHARRGGREGVTVSHALALDMFNVAQTLGLRPTIAHRRPKGSWAPNGPNGERRQVNALPSWMVTVLDVPAHSRPLPRRAEKTSRHKGVSWSQGKWYAWGVLGNHRSKNLGGYDTEEEAADVAVAFREANKFGGTARCRAEGNAVWRRVRRVGKEPYSGFVFNLEVAGDNSYVSEQIGVHNCVISGKSHSLGVWSGNDSDSGGLVLATDDEILSQYHSICGPGDNGCVITDVLDVMKAKGFRAGGRSYRIDGYCAIDNRNQLEVKVALYLFGALTVGVDLPQDWLDAPDGGTWGETNSQIVGGHDITACGFTTRGVIISTWGGLRTITWSAFQARTWVSELYCLLAPLWYNNDRLAPNGVDVATLQADLAKLSGGVIPDVGPPPGPVPPPPNPPPQPPPEPPPPEPPAPVEALFQLTFGRDVRSGQRVRFTAKAAIPAGKYDVTPARGFRARRGAAACEAKVENGDEPPITPARPRRR